MSERPSTRCPSPRACSGLMYDGVPAYLRPSLTSSSLSAIPKSTRNGLPSWSSRMFPGLTSRCTSPLRCAWCSASAMVATIAAVSPKESRSPFMSLTERRALDELRNDEARTLLGTAHVVDRDDARVIEAGDGPGFGQVGVGVFSAGNQAGVRDLDRDLTLQLLVVGQIDDAESTYAQDSLDLVAADLPRLLERSDSNGGSFRPVWLECECSLGVIVGSFRVLRPARPGFIQVGGWKLRALRPVLLRSFRAMRGRFRAVRLVRTS